MYFYVFICAYMFINAYNTLMHAHTPSMLPFFISDKAIIHNWASQRPQKKDFQVCKAALGGREYSGTRQRWCLQSTGSELAASSRCPGNVVNVRAPVHLASTRSVESLRPRTVFGCRRSVSRTSVHCGAQLSSPSQEPSCLGSWCARQPFLRAMMTHDPWRAGGTGRPSTAARLYPESSSRALDRAERSS